MELNHDSHVKARLIGICARIAGNDEYFLLWMSAAYYLHTL